MMVVVLPLRHSPGVTVRVQLLLVTALLAAPRLAGAHDFWLEPAGDGLALRYGHHGGELLAIDRAKVKAVRCLEQGGPRDLLAAAAFTPTEVRFPGRCPVAGAFFDGGFYSLTPDGEVNRPKSQVPDAVKSWASRQFAKWVDARQPGAAAAVLGEELELVAVSELTRARQGDKITFRLLSRGRPAPGAVVAIDHKPLGETDSAGEVRVKLRSATLETISATLRRKLASPEADAEVMEASLSFEVAK
jgi:nickel transport protein